MKYIIGDQLFLWNATFEFTNFLSFFFFQQTRDEEGNWSFICQHGEDECYYNRIQVCAISRLNKDRRKKLFSFISCFESLEDKESGSQVKLCSYVCISLSVELELFVFIYLQCANLIHYPFAKLEQCAKSKEGFDLLAAFGDITHNFRPKLQWVPTIVFNNVSTSYKRLSSC